MTPTRFRRRLRPDVNLGFRDGIALGLLGLRTRRLRAVLAGLGIAIGIASIVAVLGLSASSRADLVAALDKLGTNLVQIAPGQSFVGADVSLPPTASEMLRRLPAAQDVAGLEQLTATIHRNELLDSQDSNGLEVLSSEPSLLTTLAGALAAGGFLTRANAASPVVALGAVAAFRLGILYWHPGIQVWLEGRPLTVIGILAPLPLEPDLDRAVFVGSSYARRALRATGSASTIYVRVSPDRVSQLLPILGPTADPEHPEDTAISRPSDALAARAAAEDAFTSLFIALGAVALLVGGIGIANVMIVAVLERRTEIGLRRALGATRADIRHQFLTEAALLALAGGTIGVLIGVGATAGLAAARGWSVVIPPSAVAGGFGAALLIGGFAGLYPAIRASRLSPTEALRSS
jgi:putative ABC transport system permease protein